MEGNSSTSKNKKRVMTIIAIIMIGLLVCCSLGACGDTGDEGSSAQVSSSQEAHKTAAQKKKAEIEKKRREAAKKKAEAAKKAKEEKAKGEEQGSGSSDNSSSAEKSKSKNSGKSSSGASKSKSSQKASGKKNGGKSSGNNSSSQQSSKATCTISITCHKLVGNEDLSSAQRARVPSNGVIMSKTTVEIKSGDSVYDVLKRAASEKGIVISAENTALGIYVAGIDGFYEKDAGAESGWKYKVNGSYPNDSAGDVKVHDGDVIEWVYVLTA